MNATGLKRKDTTRGPPLRILSLDGGGVRGYSMLILLQELMYRTYVEIEGKAPRRHEIPKPCDHFDLIAGTGTGGLIAIMLGRLRLDIETCKNLYVRMTKRVFETDKTIAGIPYRSTLFKASKLEDAIRECVQEHTIDESEGNDSGLHPNALHSPSFRRPERSLSNVSRYSQIGASGPNMRTHGSMLRLGNPNALFYDCRDNRTKTAVTAIYKGTPKNGKPVLLRSYDSRAEPAPEFDCKIWEAGRATCATGLAFKPIQIGQSVFIDEGVGKYNPAPQVLDEAVCKEWPGREVGVIVSVGTGKRPGGTNHQQHLWWEGFVSSNIGDFAEARRRLVAKIEGCEETHQLMLKEHLSKRNVLADNYYRLNVEVGVGEFGMNEWNRLAEISTNTRMYLSRTDVQQLNAEAAAKIAKIHRAKLRWERMDSSARIPDAQPYPQSFSEMAVELPSEEVMTPPSRSPAQVSTSQSDQKTNLQHGFRTSTPSNVSNKLEVNISPRGSVELISPVRASNELQGSEPPSSSGSFDPSSRRSADLGQDLTINPNQPPPLPPKGPIRQGNGLSPLPPTPQSASHGHTKIPLPYPDTDGPPPIINLARKPNLSS